MKYVDAIFLPGIIAITIAVGWRQSHRRSLMLGAFIVVSAAELLVLVGCTVGRSLWSGLTSTTTRRNPIAKTPLDTLVGDVFSWVGALVILSVVGALVMAFVGRQLMLAVALLGTSLSALAYQLHIREHVSLSKHVGFGLIFAAPLCSLVVFTLFYLARRRNGWKRFAALFAMAVCVWLPIVTGLAASRDLTSGLPNAQT